MQSKTGGWSRSGSNGFTLIEVLISLTLLGLLTLILFGAFLLGQRALEKTGLDFHERQELRSASEILASHIRSAYPYRLPDREAGILFQGTSSDLSFVSAFSVGMGGRGMSEVQIFPEGGASRTLVLRERMPLQVRTENTGDGHAESMAVYRGVRDLRIAYLDPHAEERWLEAWDGRQAAELPRAVSIEFVDRDGKEVRWVFPIMMSLFSG